MNDIMNFFGQQAVSESFDEIKSPLPLPSRYVPGLTAK